MRLASPWVPRLAEVDGPLHERLAVALAEDVAEGRVEVGARFPAHRDLAWRLGIGIGTVTRAYGVLERRGLVASERGRGMFVASGDTAPRARVDLSVNAPPQVFADRLVATTFAALARDLTADAFARYRPPIGDLEHRRTLARWLTDHRFAAPVERLMLTNGAQHALAVAFAVAAREGRRLVTEAVTYPGALTLARHAGMTPLAVALDAEGMRPEALDAMLTRLTRSGEKAAIYLTPTLHNPTTATMGEGRRRTVVAIACRHDALIVEDDVYSLFTPRDLPTLAELAPERTFYVNGLSKTLNPGLRLGLLVAPLRLVEAAASGLAATSSMASPIAAVVMERWLLDGTAASIGASIRLEAAARSTLARRLLPQAIVPPVDPGFHVWLPMPLVAAERLARRSERAGVGVTPPSAVMVDPDGDSSGLRLCLGAPSRCDLERALTALAALAAGEGECGGV